MGVDAVPLSMSSGTLITEHDVLPDAWYLDDGRIPACIAIEAGQADLFLSGYLGVDFKTRGLAVYRLLDAAVTFHDRLPAPGSVIRYVIKLHHFFHQGSTPLFRFSFEATANGRKLMSMEKGVAGFFTAAELASGKGIVKTALDLAPLPGKVTGGFEPPVPVAASGLDDRQLDALRQGDYETAFGPAFAGLNLRSPKRLPTGPEGMLRLVHRIVSLIPDGGRYSLGRIVGEADIKGDDWFLTCHFVDDQVMPGTLMYECCLHTLRVFLMRLGWVGEDGDLPVEPVPGVASRLKCRGQVLATTRHVRYEIDIKEIGYGPDAYVLADAVMYADGRPIVDIADMSLRHLGFTAEKAAAVWSRPGQGSPSSSIAPAPMKTPPAFSKAQILAIADGLPSECFGEPYRCFDGPGRRVARLPRGPYGLLDRIQAVSATPFVESKGGTLVGDYDVPPDAWYFRAAGAPGHMPFAVLTEVALQPCGFFSAYMGPALRTDSDLYYRNLAGRAVVHRPVGPAAGILTTRVEVVDVASSAGMIIHRYKFAVTCRGEPVYDGDTTFGFFTAGALANQVGLRQIPDGCRLAPPPNGASSKPFPVHPALPVAPLLMVDELVHLTQEGGPHGLGAAHGRSRVSPDAWFFAAHFLQDPVMPGSLGLEALQQLLAAVAAARWPTARSLSGPVSGLNHSWSYRGQVLPANAVVDVTLAVTRRDDERRVLVADGYLFVDGLPIYEVKGLSIQA
jgi:3-hydroxymyristoyl/3-hydroxydecanoyl-(acyl carrier protein) dehydratase